MDIRKAVTSPPYLQLETKTTEAKPELVYFFTLEFLQKTLYCLVFSKGELPIRLAVHCLETNVQLT